MNISAKREHARKGVNRGFDDVTVDDDRAAIEFAQDHGSPLFELNPRTEGRLAVATGPAGEPAGGDYSSLSVDPVDGRTLWYTTEYLKLDGTFNWSTWIGNLIAGCQ